MTDHFCFFHAGKSAPYACVSGALSGRAFAQPLQRLLHCNRPFGDGDTGLRIANRSSAGGPGDGGIQIGAGRDPLTPALFQGCFRALHLGVVLERKLYDLTQCVSGWV